MKMMETQDFKETLMVFEIPKIQQSKLNLQKDNYSMDEFSKGNVKSEDINQVVDGVMQGIQNLKIDNKGKDTGKQSQFNYEKLEWGKGFLKK